MDRSFSRVFIETNSVVLTLPDVFRYYQYDAIIAQNEKQVPAATKNRLFYHLQNTVAPDVFNPRMIYDRQNLAYCRKLLQFSGNTAATFFIAFSQDKPVSPDTKGSYRVVLSKTGGEVIEREDFTALTNVPSSHAGDAIGPNSRGEKAKNVVQLIVRQGPNLKYRVNNGRAYFSGDPKDVMQVKHGMELWRGIFLSVRPALQKLILTVDTCATAVYRGGPLIDICFDFLNMNKDVRRLDLRPDSPEFQKLEKMLTKLRVTVKTDKKSRPKIVRALVPRAGQFEFMKGSDNITVEQYFKETYSIHLRHPYIIGVSFEKRGSGRQNVVPAELCDIEHGQICRRIPDELKADMVKFSALRPGDRRDRINREIRSYIDSEFLSESGLKLNSELIKLNGKKLSAPRIAYGDKPIEPQGGAWNVVNRKVQDSRGLTNWALLNFSAKVDGRAIDNYVHSLMKCCDALGMNPRPPLAIERARGFTAAKGLDDLTKKAANNSASDKTKPLIIIVLLDQNSGEIRTRVKYWGDIVQGVMTQCLRFDKFSRGNDQYWNNVAIKLNARLGGTNSHVTSDFWTNIMDTAGVYMIMGADVGHPNPGTLKPSVTSLVYSMDKHATKYAAMSGIQQPRQEIIENFRAYAKNAISNFVQANTVPSRIFFFRDGVSEGEYLTVSRHERDELQAAIDELWAQYGVKNPKPKITFVIVTKRHHAVFFPPGREGADRTGNCHPGIVIDTDITTPVVKNFYLQSHAAIQGTSRSSHYIILQDDNFNYNLLFLQHLCYHLCHVYAKATRSVSIPAPVYYADLVCSRLMFHFDPDVTLFDDASSANSGSTPFDLQRWQEAFKNLNPSLQHRMYFL